MRYLLIALLLMGAGCTSSSDVILRSEATKDPVGDTPADQDGILRSAQDDTEGEGLTWPVDGELTYKGFGEYIEDRFTGYHVAVDLEAPADTPVYSIADGKLAFAQSVAGYGGVMVVRGDDGRSAIYGHIDIDSVELEVDDRVEQGQQIAVLGQEGEETDGEREHLHFAVYEGDEVRLQGYESSASAVKDWLNPVDVLGINFSSDSTAFDRTYAGTDIYPLDFELPAGWDIEYIPSIESLNLYTLDGEGTARERSQILIRHFDASSFLTLSTVTIHSTEDLQVGDGYSARRYDIEKNPGVPDFKDQPSWRNERHIVTDFSQEDGFTRYYVVAASPELDEGVYEGVLESMHIR